MTNPSPRFTGIFIPIEILENPSLTLFEMMLLSIIDSLYCPKHRGCYASNAHLGKRAGNAQENTVVKSLTKLRRLGLIEDVSFDGRTRVIRALINKYVHEAQSQSYADWDKNPRGVGEKSYPDPSKNPIGVPPVLIYESKDDRKEERERATPPAPPSKLIERAKNVATTDAEHEKLLSAHGSLKTLTFYEILSEWKEDVPRSKWKKNDYRSILRWVVNAESEKQKKTTDVGSPKEDGILAQKIWDKYKARKECDIELGYKYIEFKNGMTSEHLEYGSKDFRIKVLEQLRKRRLSIEGL